MRLSESSGAILQPRSQELLEAGSAAVPPDRPEFILGEALDSVLYCGRLVRSWAE